MPLNPHIKSAPGAPTHTPDMDMAREMAKAMANEQADLDSMFTSAGPAASLPADMFESKAPVVDEDGRALDADGRPQLTPAEQREAEQAEMLANMRDQFTNFPSDEDIAQLKLKYPTLACVVSPAEKTFYLVAPVARGQYRNIMKQVRAAAESGKDEEACTEMYNREMAARGVIYPPVQRSEMDRWPAFKLPFLFEAVRQRSCWANPQQIMAMTFEL